VFDVAASETLSDEQKRRVMARLGPRVVASAQDTRSQARNRDIALERLQERIQRALVVRKPRRPTKPSKGATERRLQAKRKQSQRKAARRRPVDD
jgi:ribosome-associated protein